MRDEDAFVNIRKTICFFQSIVTVCIVAAFLATASAAKQHIGRLPPGDFVWEPELAPSGPLVVIISLPDQTLSAYRNGIRIAYSSISSGVKGRSTPPGVFTILEKEVTHFSNKYHHAPMPFMQRLTWEGVALHGGDLPGYPASHGCIRLPREFAKKLDSVTPRQRSSLSMRSIRNRPSPHLRGSYSPTRIQNLISPSRLKPNLNGIRNEVHKDQSRFWPAAQTRLCMCIEMVSRLVAPDLRSTIRSSHWAATLSRCSRALRKRRAYSCRVVQRIVGWRCERKEKPRSKISGGVCTSPRSSPRKFTISFLPEPPSL